MSTVATDVMRRIIGICRIHRTVCDKETQQLDLHRSQTVMLSLLEKQTKPIPQVEIAKQLEISTAAASVSIKKLVEGEYVEKISRFSDNRKNNIKITSKGIKKLNETRKVLSALDERVFEDFSYEELCEMERLLKKAEEAIKQIGREEKI